MAGALGAGETARQHAAIVESLIDFDVEPVIVASAAIRSDPVVERIVRRRADRDIRQRKILHHLVGHGVDQVAGAVRELIWRSGEVRAARARVSGQVIEWDVRAADGATGELL